MDLVYFTKNCQVVGILGFYIHLPYKQFIVEPVQKNLISSIDSMSEK